MKIKKIISTFLVAILLVGNMDCSIMIANAQENASEDLKEDEKVFEQEEPKEDNESNNQEIVENDSNDETESDVEENTTLDINGETVIEDNELEDSEEDFLEEQVINETEEMDALALNNKDILKDGVYFIQSSLSNKKVIDVKGGSKLNKVNGVIYQFNKMENQKWEVRHDEKGYVTFVNKKSGKVLDVSNGKKVSGTNVWQYAMNGSRAQKWIVEREGTSYKIISALDNDLVLDIKNGSSVSNTSVQIYKNNNSIAQKFKFILVEPNVPTCDEIIPSGTYYINPKQSNKLVLDIENGTDLNKANVQLYYKNESFAQAFTFLYKNGYYIIKNAYSNKALDVANGEYNPGTKVWQYTVNESNAQKWSIYKNEDGSYTFISVLNGLALDIKNGGISSGTGIQVYTPNQTEAQKFEISQAQEFYGGGYVIKSALSSVKVLDAQNGGVKNKTNIQLYNDNKSVAQKFFAVRNEDGTFSFVNMKSGLALDVANGKGVSGSNVWLYSQNNSAAQKWKVNSMGDGTWKIVSYLDQNLVLSVKKAGTANGTNIEIEKWNNLKSQKWKFEKTKTDKKLIRVEIEQGSEYVIDKNNSFQLSAKEIFTTGIGKNISWETSNVNVLSVTDSGLITGKRTGYATITAKSKTNNNVYAKIRIYILEKNGELTRERLDSINLDDVNKLMIVAHPDDETFWGGGHLLEDKYLVVCLTNGWYPERRKEFYSAMEFSEDEAIILDYADLSDGVKDNWLYCKDAIQQDLELLIGYKNWDMIVTHNLDGEYGHIHHRMTNQYTTQISMNKNMLDKLYYFGKYYDKGEVPENLKSNLSLETLGLKSRMCKKYAAQMSSYERLWIQMQPFEYWTKAVK